MDTYGLILKRLRRLKNLTIRQASELIGRSVGWISEIENARGLARITEVEFNDLVTKYDGDQYRSSFGGWIRVDKEREASSGKLSFDGAILKHLRTKAGFTLERAAAGFGCNPSYLSKLENGGSSLSLEVRDRLLVIYGYNPLSFKNYLKTGGVADNVSIRFKLNIAMKDMSDDELSRVLAFISQMNE